MASQGPERPDPGFPDPVRAGLGEVLGAAADEPPGGGRGRAWRARVGGVVLVVALCAASFWAGSVLASPAAGPPVSPGFLLATAAAGTVSNQVPVNMTVTWPQAQALVGQAAGIVTSVEQSSSGVVGAGDVLFRVDQRPVIVAAGKVPAYRSLKSGSVGSDVEQLQQFLIGQGFSVADPGGHFDGSTTTALRGWQDAVGVPVDGVLQQGDLIFVQVLPAPIVLDRSVTVGANLQPGQVVGQRLHPRPALRLQLSSDQQDIAQRGTVVKVDAVDGGRLKMTKISTTNSGNLNVAVTGKAAVCAKGCGVSPTRGTGLVSATVVLVPATAGVVVPLAAVLTDAGGATVVQQPDGTTTTVAVKAVADGRAVVTGLAAGTQVRVWASGAPPGTGPGGRPAGPGVGAVGGDAGSG